MSKNMTYATDGTAALESFCTEHAFVSSSVVAFEGGKARDLRRVRSERRGEGGHRGLMDSMRSVLDASEMYCSLRFEDFRGCSYHLFSKEGIAMLTTASTILAILSIVVSA